MLTSAIELDESKQDIKELIHQATEHHRTETAVALYRQNFDRDMVEKIAVLSDKGNEKGNRYNVEMFVRLLRPNSATLSIINWHVDSHLTIDHNFENIIDLIFNGRVVTETDRSANADASSSERERLLKMHGFGGDCKNLDGECYWTTLYDSDVLNNVFWSKVFFSTANYKTQRVSIMLGEISYMAHDPAEARRDKGEYRTRISVCPAPDHVSRPKRVKPKWRKLKDTVP